MRYFKIVFKLIMIAGIILTFQSCLKNNDFYADFSKGKPAVELPLAANNANEPIAVSFDIADTPTTYYVIVNVASVDKPTSPVTATIAIDQAYLDQYNADQKAADPDYEPFELMPDSTYEVPSWDGTVPAGQREVRIPIKIFTSKMDATHNYVLPFTISKSSIAISNWNHLMLNIGPKNQWDGVYKVAGEFYHPSYGNQVWGFSAGITQTLITTGPKSVVFGPNIKTPLVQFGIAMEITINSDNSLTEVLNGTTTPVPNSDHYDPDAKTFYVTGGYSTRTYKATLVYVKPR